MKHMYKILACILALAMLFAVTAMAAEPEVETCEAGCVHDHEDEIASENDCSNHQLQVSSRDTYEWASRSLCEMVRYVYEICPNCGDGNTYRYSQGLISHFVEPGSTSCFQCGSSNIIY